VNHPNRDLIKRAYETHLVAVISQLCLAFWTNKSDGMCPVKARSQAIILAMKKYWAFSKNMELSGGTLRIDVHDIVASDRSRSLTARCGSRWRQRLLGSIPK
jgi:hypothetical protein